MKNLIRVIFILIGVFIGYANVLKAQCGFTTGEGCPNTDYENYGVGSSIPGTLEYDNFVSVFHATIARTYDGTFKCWGENIGSNGATHITSPQVINSTNYPGLTGTPLKATAGSNFASTGQFILLTTTGLFAWGNAGNVLSTTIKSTNTFSKLTINGETDGLPIGIDPVDVKMLQATYQTLVLTTCSGSVYVLSQAGNARGNGNTGDSNTWYQVTTSDAGNPPLTNIVAARAIHNTVYALASDNTIWTWGNGSYLGDTNASAIRTRATIMTHPNTSETIKMIGITGISGAARSYFVVMTNGKLYALGNNSNRQLGDWTTMERLIWVRSKYTSTSGPDIDNVKWLSAQEHDASFGSVNIINADSTQFAWGQNAGPGMIGSTTDPGYPQIPQGVLATDKIIAVETGGHTSMNIKKCTSTFGYVGHRTNGSMGDGTTGSAFQNSYTYVTAAIDLCGASQATISLSVSANASGNFCTGEIVSLTGTPAGGTFLLLSGPGNLVGTTLTFTGTAGTVVVQYTVNNSCGIPVSTSINIPVAISPDAGPNQSFCGIAGSVNMSATGAGVWSLASGNPGTATIVTPSSANTEVNSFSAFGTYKLYYTNAGSCVDSAFVMVNNCLPSWTLQKTSTTVPNNYDQVGDILAYNIEITNTGNVSISSVVVTDPTATSGPTYVSGDLGVSGTMEVGEVWNYTASRTVNQANLDAGSYANTASVTGVPVGGILSPASDMETIPAIQNPSIQIIKTGTYVDNAPVGIYNAGDQITYEFSVENTGNVTLTNVTVSDPQVTITGSPIASLAPGAINTVAYTATKTLTQTDIDNGVFTNTATVTGTPPIGPTVTNTDDDTQNFIQNPSVQIIKAGSYVDNAPVGVYNAGDQITYEFSVENTGNVTLTNVTVSDAQVTITGSPIASLAPGAINTVAYTATKTLTQTDIDNGLFTNTATVTGTPPIGPTVTDTDDDTQNFIQNPSVQIIKAGSYVDNAPVGIYNAGDQITYAFSVENTGNVTLTNVTVSDAQVTITGSPIASLAPGAINTVAYTATKTLTQTDIDNGLFTNTATVTGTPPIGPNVTDTDDDTQNFIQNPSVQIIKAGSYVDNAPVGIYNAGDQITYEFSVENTGNVTLTNVTVSDLQITVTGSPIAILVPGAINTVAYTATKTLTQTDIDNGVFTNSATVTGTPPIGPNVTDMDDDTQNFTQTPAIALTKASNLDLGVNGISNPGDIITYTYVIHNTGNVTLSNVVISEQSSSFTGTGILPLPVFSSSSLGSVEGILQVGESAIYTAPYAITQADINEGLIYNQAMSEGQSPANVDVNDLSDSNNVGDPNETGNPGDLDENDATGTYIPQTPIIGISKTISSGPVNNNDGTYSLTYSIGVENMGNTTLYFVQVVEDLNQTFGGATNYSVVNVSSGDFTVNPNFDGNTDTNLLTGADNLLVSGSGTITLSLMVTPGANLGPYSNTAVATSEAPSGMPVTDDSQNGTDVDPDNNDDPTDNDDPTSVTFTENPSIGIAKAITNGPINNNDGTYSLTYTMLVENIGDVLLNNLQVVENLNTTFAGATSYTVNSINSTDFSVNNNFNGNSDINLLSGSDDLIYQGSGSITLTVTVTPGSNLGAYNNTAVANGTSPANQSVTDNSQNGTDVDSDNNDDPTDNDDPTSITFTENPSIGIAKAITNGPINNNDGTYTLTYTMLVENTGDVLLNNIQVVENLNTTFAGATSYTVNSIGSTDFTVNNNFNGNSDINLLSGTDNLIYQGSGSITITITITPGSNLGAYNNTAVANGNSPANQTVTDDSQDGTDVDPDNNDDPTDNDDPTSVTFTENPSIGIAKAITNGPINNNDGTYTLTYTMLVENTGDVLLSNVQVVENLNTTFAGATSYTVNNISSTNFTVNNNFNGNSDINLLSGTDNLIYQGSGSITLTVTITPGSNLGAYNNTAVANGNSPANQSVTDDSQNGTDVDPDNNDDPTDNDDPTSITFTENPSIGIAKAITNGPINNNDGTYTLTYTMLVENTGDVLLNNVQVVENLNTTFAGATSYTVNSISSTDFTVNNNFNGNSDINLLSGTDNLIYQGSGSITMTVTITPGSNLGAYNNTSVANGNSPANQSVTDNSQDGTDVDPDNNNDPTDNDEPTSITFTENPSIGIAKAITNGPINNNDGTYTLTYTMLVENTGDVLLNNVQVVENLNTTFAGATNYTVDNISSTNFTVNNNFNGNSDINLLSGTDNLIYQGSGSITLTVTITPGSNLGAYNNTAVANGTSPANQSVTDDSQNGTDVDPDNNDDPTDNDDPTPITFTESPSISVVKGSSLALGTDAIATVGDIITYTYVATNTGDVTLQNVTIDEQIGAFTGNGILPVPVFVNASMGSSAGTILSGESATYTATYALTQTDIDAGIVHNQVLVAGLSPSGATVSDLSDSSNPGDINETGNVGDADENDATSTIITQTPAIALTKASNLDLGVNGISNPGDIITYTYVIHNTGNVTLSNVVISEQSTSFTGTGILPLPVFGSSSLGSVEGILQVGESAIYTAPYAITQADINEGLIYNQAMTEGQSPANVDVNDLSDSNNVGDPNETGNPGDLDENDATGTYIPQTPIIGISKTISSGPVNNNDGTYSLTYSIGVENMGNTTLYFVQVVEDLNQTFSGATNYSVVNVSSGDFTVNPNFDGNTDTNLLTGADNLLVSGSGTITLSLMVTPGANLGPYSNTAVATSEAPSGMPVTDDSQNGTDVDPDNNDDPTDNDDPTSITFTENPSIGIAKAITNGPINNNDGTYTLTYTMLVENTGDVLLNNIQLVENLNTTFAGATSYTVNSISSTDFTVNNNFNGNSDINLLSGTDNLIYQGSGSITMTVTITPGSNLGAYNNTAVANANSPANQSVTDDSQDGTDVDPDNNDDPTDNDEPTSITFTENPSIGIAKAITNGPINNNDGTYTLTYTMLVENTGDVLLNNLQVVENLNATFAGATSYTVDNISSTDFTVNNNFNGNSDTNLLSGTDNLIYQGSGSITMTVTVTPGSNLGAYNNTAVANANSPANQSVTDDSQDGTDVDPDNNDDPTDNDEPTSITFTENPSIGIAKAITNGPINNNDGTYTLTYTMLVENTGDVLLNNLQVAENLNTTFGGATSYTVNSISSTDFTVNNNFNGNSDINLLSGTDDLIYQGSGSITLTVTITPGSNLGAYNNTAIANGNSPANQSVTDNSQNGTDVDPDNNDDPTDNDDPTSVSFTESPSISVVKGSSLALGTDAIATVGDIITYTYVATNPGDVTLQNVTIDEQIGAFTGNGILPVPVFVNASMGSSVGTILSGESATYTATYALTQTDIDTGIVHNQVLVAGLSPSGATVSDLSDSSNPGDINETGNVGDADENDATSTIITQTPAIALTKASNLDLGVNGISNPGDIITYTYVIHNTGNVTLSNVVISEQSTSFTGTGILPLPVFGSSSLGSVEGILQVGESAIYTAPYAITQADINEGLIYNQAMTEGQSPANVDVNDLSDSNNIGDPNETGNPGDLDENDATGTYIPQTPIIGISKTISSGPVNNNDGTYSLTYSIGVENMGNTTLYFAQVVEDLNQTFGGATNYSVVNVSSGDFTVNPNFDGNTDTNLLTGEDNLLVSGSGTITLSLTVTPGANLGPYSNTAVATSEAPSGMPVTDDSQDGIEVDPDNNDDPTDNDDPTSVTFTENPSIGIAKAITNGPINNNDGTYTLTYTMLVENTGDVLLNNVQVVENLNTTFAGATSYTVDNISSTDFTVNNNFNGNSDINLLSGTDDLIYQESGSITMTVTITPGFNLGAYNNTAVANGTSPANQSVTDDSQNGTDVDPDNNDDPTDNDDPTSVTFTENPSIGIAKAITNGPSNNNDGTYTLTYTMLVENTGDVLLDNVQVVENLNTTFGGATSYTVDNISSTDFTVNNNFNGNSDINLLSGTDDLIYQGSGSITLTVTVTPGSNLGAYNNTAIANGTSPANQSVTDDSQNGTDVDPDNNNDPTDNNDPTSITFTENPSIGIAKAITNGPINNNDGTYTLTYTMLVENTGDVLLNNLQVVENLNTTFAGATSYTVNSISSTDFTVNNNFNGNSDINLLSGTDNLIYQGSGSITMTVTITPGSNLGAYNNTAIANGNSPANQSVTDNSQNGTDVDPDNNDDPTDNDDPTSITFTENPSIGIAKAITNGPINNNDGTYTLTYTMLVENTGDVLLKNVQVFENLNTTFAGSTSYTVNNISSTNFTVNNNFNGNSDINLLDGTDNLIYQGSGSIILTVTITPGSNLGAYNNTAVANGTSPANQSVTDNSQNGTDVDPDNNDDPTDNNDPTSVTFTENPSIGIAKAITNGPINNNDGTYALTYTLLVENTGDVLLSNLQVVDNLNTTFAGSTNYTVNNISSTDFTVNNNFNGNSDINLLSGTDNLIYQGSGSITLTVTITPGSNLGAYNNTAVANGTSPANQSVTDNSQNGTEVDPDNNDDPTDNDDPTSVTFTENPSIGIAKAITNGPINNNDGTYTLTYTMLVENTGDVLLNNIQVVENLSTTFAGATSYTVNSISSTDFTVNNNFNGNSDINLLSSTDDLIYQGSGSITLTVTITPGSNLGAYNNTAVANGNSPANQSVTDYSQNGTDVDPDNNDDPTDNDDSTSITFTENPNIGISKALTNGPINKGNQTYDLEFTMILQNTGDVPLSNIQVIDDLALTFAAAESFTINSVTTSANLTVNPLYNGTTNIQLLSGNDGLAYNETGTITLSVNLRPGINITPFENVVIVNGESPSGALVSDDSQDGDDIDPDNDNNPSNNGDPTPIPIPAVAVLKDLTSSVLLPDGDVRLTFDLLVKNIGNVTMTNLILEDNLLMSSAFSSTPDFVVSVTNLSANIPPSANISYNGVTDINLITGNSNLAPAQEFRIALSFDVNPVLFSQLNNDFKKNQAVVFGTPRDQNGNVLINKSTASFYTPREVFDASDDISGLVLGNIFDTNNGANGDGLGLNPYDNPTPITMPSSIKVLKAISATNPPVQLLNGNYRVTYDFDVINNGGQVLQSIQLEDDIAAQYGCAFIGNASVPLISLSNNSYLSVLPTVNNLFVGAGSEINMLLGDGILYPGDTIHLTTSLEIDPSCINPASPLENQATVFAIDETESSVNDLSDDVTDMNDDGLTDYPGLGLDDPTPLEIPSINVVKSLTNIKNANSNIPGNKDVTYRFTIQNTGNTNLVGIDLIDQLQSQLAPVWVGITTMPNIVLSTASVTPILNPNFNGGSQANMFNGTSGNLHPGQFVTVQLTIEIDPNKDNTYPQLTNQVTTNADVILGNGIQITVTDASDDGVNPKGINPNYLGDTGTSNDPTPLIVPAISTVKNVVSYQNALSGIEGHYDVVMNISVKNIGNVNLTNISLLDTIELTKYVGPYFVGLAPTTSPNIINSNLTQNPTLNNAFNGRLANSNIFDGNSGLMAPGQAFTVQLRIELDATLQGLPDSLWNRVSAYGDAAQNDGSLYYLVSDGDPITTSDDSDAGYDHESTNSNQPEDLGTSNDKTLIEVLGEIGDFVWNDLDGDGIQDLGEPGLANVLVGLYDCNDQFIRSVTTDANGAFALTNVLKGQYKLKFDFSNLGNGYAFTLPNVGNDALNSDANPDGFTNCFILNAGERSDDIDAGLVRLANIGKFVWDDLNGDGLQSSSEPGISGVQVKIFLADGTLVDSTVTSSNGQYEFIGLYPGNYYLTFTTPDGYSFTFANSGSNDAVDSDVNGANGLGTTSVFTLFPGVTINTLNAGMYRCIPIGDLVWYDLNKNDVWDSNENGINGLPVNLWRSVGGTWIIWDTKFTGFKPNSPSADGYFNFCAPPGQYYIEVIIPQLGLVRARPNIGNNEEIDSDLTNAFGVGTSASFTVTSGQQKNDLGAGYYPMAIAGNLVWQDDNQNGLQDDEEPKVAGIKVQAYDANTHLVVAEAITDEEGKYTLDYLERADIYIKFDVPAGFSPTIARATDDTMDSDVDHSYGPNTTRMFAMESGMVNENIDLGIAFGVLPVVWLDVNASRVNNTHIVSWRTAKEVNVVYYVVERRFSDETVFTEIPGKVTVNGNTNAIQAYSLIDQDVALSGVYIYRVKQVDFDGKYTYSKLVSVQNQGEDIITLYPNPAKGEANLEISLTKDGEVSVEIFDNTSKLVKVVATEQQQLQGVKSYPLNLQDMSAGIYNLKISINGVVTHKKLIRIE